MQTLNFMADEGLVIVPVLYILGMIIKEMEKIPDKYIPLILLGFGCCLSILLLGASVSSFIQGVLLTGTAVYGNQIFKQMSKNE
ncbi:MAG: holin [Clostridia bacterium]|nr:holin [Clostridia bacterium]